MKADLAIYSHIVDVSGQRMSVSLILGFKLDFSSCAIWDGFCKFSHICWKINKVQLNIQNLLWGPTAKVFPTHYEWSQQIVKVFPLKVCYLRCASDNDLHEKVYVYNRNIYSWPLNYTQL